MWLGWSSRVRLPERKTDESLSKVSFPSGAEAPSPAPSGSACAAFALLLNSTGGSFPFVTVIALASAPPRKKPLSKTWRMLRTSRDPRARSSPERLVVGVERGSATPRAAGAERSLGGHDPRLDRVMDPLQRGTLTSPAPSPTSSSPAVR